MIEIALYSKLINDAGVSALISNRLYLGKLPQNPTYPCALYNRITTNRVQSMAGSTGLVEASFEVIAFADTQLAALQLADAIRSCLDSFSGTVSLIEIQSILITGQSTVLQTSELEAQTLRGVQLEFQIWFTE